MQTSEQKSITARRSGGSTWLQVSGTNLPLTHVPAYEHIVLDNEDAVGQAMFEELESYANSTDGDIVMVLLGGRGAQAMYRLIADKAATGELDELGTTNHDEREATTKCVLDLSDLFDRLCSLLPILVAGLKIQGHIP